MTDGEAMAAQVCELVRLFAPHCADRETLDALGQLAADQQRWPEAHVLFRRIRDKTLRTRDRTVGAQYTFEEICAKSLYNMTSCDDPFDPDSPYFIVPYAIRLARALRVPEAAVLAIVTAD